MTTVTKTDDRTTSHDVPDEERTPRRRSRRSIVVVVAVALAALTGFAVGWLGAGSDEAGDDDIVADVRAVQEDWFAAWNADDGDAVLAMMVPGGRHYCPATGSAGVSGRELVALVEEGWEMTDARIVSATRARSADDQTVGADHYVVITEFTLDGRPNYQSVLHLRGPDGALRVQDHHVAP